MIDTFIVPEVPAVLYALFDYGLTFNHPKKLVAFAGLDPSVFESGTFKG
ncbi:transposase [Solibacillus sp. FSL W7-1464]